MCVEEKKKRKKKRKRKTRMDKKMVLIPLNGRL